MHPCEVLCEVHRASLSAPFRFRLMAGYLLAGWGAGRAPDYFTGFHGFGKRSNSQSTDSAIDTKPVWLLLGAETLLELGPRDPAHHGLSKHPPRPSTLIGAGTVAL